MIAPDAIQVLNLDSSVEFQVSVSWDKPAHIYGPVAKYTVSVKVYIELSG